MIWGFSGHAALAHANPAFAGVHTDTPGKLGQLLVKQYVRLSVSMSPSVCDSAVVSVCLQAWGVIRGEAYSPLRTPHVGVHASS